MSLNCNRVKIIYNQEKRIVAYSLQNEQGKWIQVSDYSELAQEALSKGNIDKIAPRILSIINTTYNQRKRGVELFYEGPPEGSKALSRELERHYSTDNILFARKKTIIAVAGKTGTGKSALIKALLDLKEEHHTITKKGETVVYSGVNSSDAEWHELPGIGFGLDSIRKTQGVLEELANQGLAVLLYCTSTNRIETPERELLERLSIIFPQIKTIIVMTDSVSEEDIEAAKSLERNISIQTIPVLAKSKRIRSGLIPSHGLDLLLSAIFEER